MEYTSLRREKEGTIFLEKYLLLKLILHNDSVHTSTQMLEQPFQINIQYSVSSLAPIDSKFITANTYVNILHFVSSSIVVNVCIYLYGNHCWVLRHF